MNKKLHQIFQNMPEKKPDFQLIEKIIFRINLEKHKRMKRLFWLYRFSLFGSLIASLSAIEFFGKYFLNSEFWSIISLFFSDMSLVMANWKAFTYSILENMPVVEIIATLFPIFISLILFNAYSKLDSKKMLTN